MKNFSNLLIFSKIIFKKCAEKFGRFNKLLYISDIKQGGTQHTPTNDQNFTAMNTDQLTTYTRLMKNLWRIYAAAPAARKSAIYADIERTAAAMCDDLYTAVIDNLMTL